MSIAELINTPFLLVHVSTKASRDHVRVLQARRLPIHADNLLYMSDVLNMLDFEGAKAALWEGIANGFPGSIVQPVPIMLAPSARQNPRSRCKTKFAKFSGIPNGLSSVEMRLLLGYQGIVNGKISIENLIEVACTNPAKLYGLDQKGTWM
ncbi:uncharacterized protein V1513DRAFT_427999 [Lipomyces chichibuensis]|uniref:uncharacterized protein n=1 Tax=Lipomyces chichibuensis TaxID=1546026 RepID=UPI0033436532